MNPSLFIEYIDKYFRLVIGKITEKINGKKTEEQLLHKTMLTEEYSADLTWGSTELNTSVVAADVVAMDSSLPLKKRDKISNASGVIPKIGIKFSKGEKAISDINVMRARGADETTVVGKIFDDAPKAIKGVDVRKEIMFQEALSTGVTLVPEGRRVFPNLTVLENLKIGAYLRKDKDGIAKDRAWVYSLFPRLQERTWQLGATLSGGEQQMLAVGRALMSRPKLLMLDEPSLGLAPLIIKDIFTIIQQIKDAGVNVLLIEQNAKAALEISDYAYVMETGNITMAGPGRGKALMNDERVKAAYLGE